MVMVNVPPCNLLTVLAPSVPATSPATLAVNAVEAMPFTVLTNWFAPFWLNTLLLMMVAVWAVPPAIAELKVFVAELKVCVIATAVPVVPFTVVETLPDATVLLTVAGATAAGAHAVPFHASTFPFAAPVVVPSGEPLIFETTLAEVVPVTSPARVVSDTHELVTAS